MEGSSTLASGQSVQDPPAGHCCSRSMPWPQVPQGLRVPSPGTRAQQVPQMGWGCPHMLGPLEVSHPGHSPHLAQPQCWHCQTQSSPGRKGAYPVL